ncbi:hypothetical protein K0M31_017135 [Melipona bicolor]|uniref:Uncharacterized protein n=1 Tax=Melipona bicolor TaxID=60889 RepID=A0AA40KE13_9HYME|nr:hypothetical protein K0M31_017135 [Melipona bicolor]
MEYTTSNDQNQTCNYTPSPQYKKATGRFETTSCCFIAFLQIILIFVAIIAGMFIFVALCTTVIELRHSNKTTITIMPTAASGHFRFMLEKANEVKIISEEFSRTDFPTSEASLNFTMQLKDMHIQLQISTGTSTSASSSTKRTKRNKRQHCKRKQQKPDLSLGPLRKEAGSLL